MKLSTPRVRFRECDAGWIHFTIAVGKQSTDIRASHLYDPFPNMLRWLEKIVAGKRRSSFRVDQEGVTTEFVAVQKDAGTLLFGVRDIGHDHRVRIRKRVDGRQFVNALYSGFQKFTKSKRYVEEQWAMVSLGDRLSSALPEIVAEKLPSDLATLDDNTLRKLLFHVAPSYEVSFEGEDTVSKKVGRFVDLVLHPDSEEAKRGLIETPTEWDIPADFSSWPINRREEHLQQLLGEPANSWNGSRLDRLSSPLVEEYLATKPGE